MRIAILHYHLNRGGVTQVIANQIRALANLPISSPCPSVAIFFGGRMESAIDEFTGDNEQVSVSCHVVPELDYDLERPHQTKLIDALQSALREAGCDPPDTILHIHNHALGKNSEWPSAVRELGRRGYGLLLQLHDFAEDFRPNNYRDLSHHAADHNGTQSLDWLYPQGANIHYAVLNRRDFAILRDAGVCPSRLHLLPNPVGEPGPLPNRERARAMLEIRAGVPKDAHVIVYPVRGIRRKNLGEALFWSALAGDGLQFGLTLPATNPIEQPRYFAWKQLSRELHLPWTFELGSEHGIPFAELIAAADSFMTTSVAEGFGQVFLESWLGGRDLIGRDLPEITVDFISEGLQFPSLRSRLLVPVKWFDRRTWQSTLRNAYKSVLEDYGRPVPDDGVLDTSIDGLVTDGLVDFATCGSAHQALAIRRIAENAHCRSQVRALNPWIDVALCPMHVDSALIDHNAHVVREKYSLAVCGERLAAIYKQVARSPRDLEPSPLGDSQAILDRFLDLSRFHPLRVEA